MWENLWPDLAVYLVKGLLAGGAFLAFQWAAPKSLHALKRFRARWFARAPKKVDSSTCSASACSQRCGGTAAAFEEAGGPRPPGTGKFCAVDKD